jgi:acyl-CoA synthetase (NDP forming)
MSEQIDRIFYPKSVAIVGASSKTGSLSFELIKNMITFG